MGEGATAEATAGEKAGAALASCCGDSTSAVALRESGVGVLMEGVVGVAGGAAKGAAAGSCTWRS